MASGDRKDEDRFGRDTPVEEMGPVPGWLILVYVGLVLWGALYFATNWKIGRFG